MKRFSLHDGDEIKISTYNPDLTQPLIRANQNKSLFEIKTRRLLLVSMSGVRIKNEKLLKSGMTLPGFLERSEVIASLPNLGLLTIAAYTPANWEIEYQDIDLLDEEDIHKIVDANFDLIGISFLTARAYDAYRFADFLRACNQTVVFGGLHTSLVPKESAQHADTIVVGEAEPVWGQLIHDFENDHLRKVYQASNKSIPGFIDGPVPRYDLLDFSKYNRITLQTTRGCPLHCEFCGASHLISPVRRKSIQQIRKELEAILGRWPRPFIELADDNTFVNKSWTRELLELFAQYPIKWFTETDISIGEDPELLDLLARSHCAQLLIGLESPNPGTLSQMDPGKWKARKQSAVSQSVLQIQNHGISVNGCFILGNDGEDVNSFRFTLEMIDQLNLAETQITVLTPFPGTKLYQRLKKEGRLLKNDFWDQCTLFDVCFQPDRMSVEELESGFFDLMQEVYSRDRVQIRKTRLNECIRTRASLTTQID